MKLATFNTNSIRARLPIILDWLKHESPDVLCLQETKVQDRDFPASPLEEAGYQAVFSGQKAYNGVAVLSRLPVGKVHKGLSGSGEEARFISAEIAGVPVLNVYVPQGLATGTEKFAYKLRWLNDLLLFLGQHHSADHPLLVAGDFNIALEPIDVFDPHGLQGEVGFHPDERAIMTKFLSWGLTDIFRKYHSEGGHYTFWDYRIPHALKRKMGWRIDYILATAPIAEKCASAWIDIQPRLLEKPSDHTFLVAEFDW